MKKLLLLLLLPFVLSACDKDRTEYQTWTVASEMGATSCWFGYGFIPAYIVQTGPGMPWEVCSDSILGLSYEEGYEYTIRVRIDPIPNPPADGSDRKYTMTELISKQKKQSAVDIEDFCPTLDVAIASVKGTYDEYTCYWFKDLRYTDPKWQPLPVEIEGFDYQPGYEYRLHLKVSARMKPGDYYHTVAFGLVEEVSKEQTSSEGIPR